MNRLPLSLIHHQTRSARSAAFTARSSGNVTLCIRVVGWFMLFCLAVSVYSCSSGSSGSSNTSIAGSSGAGNPGSVVALAMVADGKQETPLSELAKSLALTDSSNAQGRKVGINDRSGLSFSIESARVYAKEIRFVFADSVDAGDPFWTKNDDVTLSGNSALLTGPFEFDAMTGDVTPSTDALKIPATEYALVQIWVAPRGGGRADSPVGIKLGGTFRYRGKERPFVFKLSINAPLLIKHPDLFSFELEGKDTTCLAIRLNATKWLDSINVKHALLRKDLTFNDQGVLEVESAPSRGGGPSNGGPINAIPALIARAVMGSAKLDICSPSP